MLNLDNILFLDTESDPDTKQPECIQYLIGDKEGIIEEFNKENYDLLKDLWNTSEAVLMFNGPYDMGVLSAMFDNSYRWVKDKENSSAQWDIILFKNRYFVRKLGFFRNLIKPLNRVKTKKDKKKGIKSTPVVDLLKLWSILIDDGRKGSIGLKALIKRELKLEAIPYTPEAARTTAYRLQDVRRLKDLTELFLEKVQPIEDLRGYTWVEWSFVKTPATFTKLSYQNAYPDLPIWKKENTVKTQLIQGLQGILETAFNGGLTFSFYRGKLINTGWVDISGAYAHAMEFLNTDQYLRYDIDIHDTIEGWDYKKTQSLLYIRTNFVLRTVNDSLKMFALEEPVKVWMWYDDVQALQNFNPGMKYEVLKGFEFISLVNVNTSLVADWIRAKDLEKKLNGSSTYYDFCKFRSNTGYGIKAQRKPFETIHTNMVIAGMITSTVHLTLSQIFKVVRKQGYKARYCDTDSCCFHHGTQFNKEAMTVLLAHINKEIFPYTVESEGYKKDTTILSLKRYVSEKGTEKDKVKLHGKGRYNVAQKEIYDFVINGSLPEKPLKVTQIAANTEISTNQILNIYPQLEQYKHPFMFVTDVPVQNKDMSTFFYDWFQHIDTKTTFELSGTFKREFHTFEDMIEAVDFFTNYNISEESESMDMSYRNWDLEIKEDFE